MKAAFLGLGLAFMGSPTMAGPTAFLLLGESPEAAWIYDGACAPEESHECVIASLQCGEYGGITADMNSLEPKAVSKWFADGPTVEITGVPGLDRMEAYRAEIADFDGLWVMTFRTAPGTKPVIQTDRVGSTLSIGPVSAPLTASDRAGLGKMLAGCP